jgi:hypothetical protein
LMIKSLSPFKCAFIVLLFCILIFSSACLKIVPKTTDSGLGVDSPASGSGQDFQAPSSGDTGGSSLEINNNDFTVDEPPGSSTPAATAPPSSLPANNPSTPATATTIPAQGCDLKIQPESLTVVPGIYTFTAVSPSAVNAIYQWDIEGLISQTGPQNTFAVNLNSPGTGTISVTLLVNNMPVCKATSYVNVKANQTTPQCDLRISPASMTNISGTYTFTASTSYSNALFIWDINGYQQAYGPGRSFTVTFNSEGYATVSVTMVIDGVPVCSASSKVSILPPLMR